MTAPEAVSADQSAARSEAGPAGPHADSEMLLREVAEIARMMTSTRSIDAVIQDVLRRARRLTGADMAYVSLNRSGETFIRYHDGIRTEGYRTIRMPLGTGVLGRAATGREPVTTRGYLFDASLVHLPEIDRRVQAEGVQSILGMPMTLHGVVLGALLIADRRDVTYRRETFEILETLALHTAVALEYATRIDEVTAALTRLHESRELDHERAADLQEVLHLESTLLESIVDEADLSAFARSVRSVLGAPVAILDPDGHLAARSSDGSDGDGVEPGELRRERGLAGAISLARTTGQVIVHGHLTVACALGAGEHLATLVLGRELPPPLHPRIQRIVVFLAIITLMTRAQQDEESRRDRRLLEALVGAAGRTSRGEDELAALGIGPARPYRLVCASVAGRAAETGDALEDLQAAVIRAVREHGATVEEGRVLVARHGEHLCIVAPEEIWSGAIEGAMTTAMAARPGIAGGMSGLLTDRTDGPLAHRLAEQARRTLELLGVTGRIALGEGLGAAGLLAEALHERPEVRTPLTQLEPLVAYDRDHDVDLIRTAWVLAESGGSVARTAERLFVHQNTVRQRLSRIAALIGDDWRDPSRFLDMHLALRIWALGNG